jgi:hypothetical protein
MPSGYIYVLVNSAMPGLVKVGKTTRLPSDRAQELSTATGVATPFVVAFEHAFADVDTVERLVHSEMEQRGFRESKNREFFRVASSEVVRIILAIAESCPGPSGMADKEQTLPVWTELLDQAAAYLDGEDDTFQDVDEALRLYKAAARLGSPEACRQLGDIYRYGQYVRENHKEAIEWFKEGGARGNYGCYIALAWTFARHGQGENAIKAFRKFFEAHDAVVKEATVSNLDVAYDIEQYVHICLDHSLPIEFPEFIASARATILARVEPRLQDRIFDAERKELTRVRNILRATMQPAPSRGIAAPPYGESDHRLPPVTSRPGFIRRLFSF